MHARVYLIKYYYVVLKTPFDDSTADSTTNESQAYLVSSNDSFFTWRRSKPLLQLQNVSNITHVFNLTIKTIYKWAS